MKRFFLTLISLSLLGCATYEASFEEGTSPEVIKQRAQEAFDAGAYEDALAIYALALDRFSDDPKLKAEILYEIAFTHQKSEDLESARAGYRELLALYEDSSLEPFLPGWPRVLAEKLLEDLIAQEEATPE
jgi:tetratricopeptide (TPR) repeat protein